MARKRYKPEEIVAKLRQVDVLLSQGQSTAEAVRQIGVTETTYFRWRREFGGLKTDQSRRGARSTMRADLTRLLETVRHPSSPDRPGLTPRLSGASEAGKLT
jgi:transposase-like protein